MTNWSLNRVPLITDDVLIASGKTCTVSGSNNDALCKSLEVAGTLEIQDGNTLNVKPPVTHSFTDLLVDGTLEFTDATETGVLLLEMTGIGDHVFDILGEGNLIGDPADMQTSSGSSAILRVKVGPETEGTPEVLGTWDISVDVENNATFIAGSGHSMIFDKPSANIAISGSGSFAANVGYIEFNEPTFDPGVGFKLAAYADGLMWLKKTGGGIIDVGSATIDIDDADMEFGEQLFLNPPVVSLHMDGGSIEVTGGGLLDSTLAADLTDTQVTIAGAGSRFLSWGGLYVDGCTISMNGGEISSVGGSVDVELEDSTLSLTGASEFNSDTGVDGDDVTISLAGTSAWESGQLDLFYSGVSSTITVEDSATFTVAGKFNTGNPSAQGEEFTVSVLESATWTCTWFSLDECDVTIGGTFHVTGSGSNGQASTAALSSITLSGGLFKIAWGLTGGYDLTLNGTLQVLQSTDTNDVFSNTGSSQFLGGSILVKQGEKVMLE